MDITVVTLILGLALILAIIGEATRIGIYLLIAMFLMFGFAITDPIAFTDSRFVWLLLVVLFGTRGFSVNRGISSR